MQLKDIHDDAERDFLIGISREGKHPIRQKLTDEKKKDFAVDRI